MMQIKKIKIMKDYPSELVSRIKQLTKEDIINLLNHSEEEKIYVKGVTSSIPFWYSSSPEDGEEWVRRTYARDGIMIIAYRPSSDSEGAWAVEVMGYNPSPDFERSNDDGRCLNCEGWGCWSCNYTGGY